MYNTGRHESDKTPGGYPEFYQRIRKERGVVRLLPPCVTGRNTSPYGSYRNVLRPLRVYFVLFVASTGRMETVSWPLLSSPPCPCYISKMFHSPLRANLKMSRKPVRNRGNSYIARSNYSGLVCRVKDEQAPRWGVW